MNDLHPPGPTTSGDTVRQVAVAATATTTADAEAPPIYARTDDGSDEGGRDQEQENELEHEPQIVILPSTDAVRFQHGFLGADGERAAIEGEVQIKGADRGVWSRVTVGLCTTERAYGHAIELGATELTLFDNSRAASDPAPVPASLPFSIPLTADTPQCVHTPQSSLTHVLTATLHRAGPDTGPALSKSVTVHTRRFAAHAAAQPIAPVRRSIHAPARIEVEVPRTTFAASEPIPVYVTVPSPRRELVVDEGLRLRNIKAELVRFVRVRESFGPEDTVSSVDVDIPEDLEDAGGLNGSGGGGASGTDAGPSNTKLAGPSASSSAYARAPLRTAASGTLYSSVVSRSGALCRFHTSLPVRLRFVLHQSSPAPSPSTSPGSLPSDGSAGVSGAGSGGVLGGDAECAGISQNTLLHAVGFRLRILATFRHTSTHTERVCTLALPITLLPPPAPLPEVSADVDRAYQKKHDKPPARTVRGEETDADAAPHYDFAEGRAGPSFVAGAPPPFDDRDAPPPFSADGDSAPSSSRLPTFLESESAQHIYVPPADAGVPAHDATSHYDIVGEGVYFGFPASAQFSGHADDVGGGIGIGLGDATPPPTLEQATLDANVTELAQLDLGAPERAMHVLGLVLDEAPPPLPPPLDDPADPPPSIDQEYRSREGIAHQIQSPHALPPSLPPPSSAPPPSPMPIPPPPAEGMTSPAHAPPPYLVPEGERGHEHEHVSRPPPYVDYMPPETG